MYRTLVVTADPAWPPISGADLRSWQNVTALAELGAVTVASVQPLVMARPPSNPDIEVVGLTVEGERGESFRRRRTSADRNIPKPAASRLSRLASDLRPDSVLVEGICLHPLLSLVRPFTKNLVLDMHNIESDLSAQIRDTRSPMARWSSRMVGRDPERIRDAELAAAKVVDRVWVCSSQDQRRLVSIAGRTVQSHIVPNGVPRVAGLHYPTQPLSQSENSPIILFVGHLGYEPNVRAVIRLAEKVMPLVREKLPRSRLLVVGRDPTRMVRKLSAGGAFDLVENPVEVSKYLARSSVVVVPLELGGGTRLKILEAIAAGVPVVATPLAAEGLDLVDGVHVLLASTDRELAHGVVELCSDSDRWCRQRQSARSFVMETFGPAAISRAVHKGLG